MHVDTIKKNGITHIINILNKYEKTKATMWEVVEAVSKKKI